MSYMSKIGKYADWCGWPAWTTFLQWNIKALLQANQWGFGYQQPYCWWFRNPIPNHLGCDRNPVNNRDIWWYLPYQLVQDFWTINPIVGGKCYVSLLTNLSLGSLDF